MNKMSKKVIGKKQPSRHSSMMLYVLLFMLLVIGILLLVPRKSGVELEVLGQKLKIDLEEIPYYQQELNDKITGFQSELTAMERLEKEQSLNRVLKDSIATLIYLRQREINKGTELSQKLSSFKSYPEESQEKILKEVLNLLSSQTSNVDFGLLGKSLTYESIIAIEKEKNRKLEKRVSDLLAKVGSLKATIKKLKQLNSKIEGERDTAIADKNELNRMFKEAVDQLNQLKLLAEQGDSTQIWKDQIEELGSSLKEVIVKNEALIDDVSGLNEIISGTQKISLNKTSFRPLNAKQKKNEAFLIRQTNKIRFECVVNFNVDKESEVETFKIVFLIPIGNSEFATYVKSVNAKHGQRISIDLEKGKLRDVNNEIIKFKSGVYSAQVFHSKTSEDKPILIEHFNVVKNLF